MIAKKILLAAALAAGSTFAATPSAHAQAEPYLGQMMLVPYDFCPRGWSEARGQLLPISQYTALFSLLGTTYGGDGRTTFGLPDLRGRIPVGVGDGPGLNEVRLGEKGGSNTRTLTVSNLPSHNHMLRASTEMPNSDNPTNALLADFPNSTLIYRTGGSANTEMAMTAISNTGGSIAFSITNPFLGQRYCIAMQGIFPSRG
jgi:microcystin-dependent protein